MGKKIQVIIVDDNKAFLECLSSFLIDDRYEIIAKYTSGIEFLENISSFDPDIVLLDIEMPLMNGIEIARKLNYFGAQLNMVAITLYHDRVYIKQLMGAGFRGMISKNDVSDRLFHVLDKVMQGELAFPNHMEN